MRDERCIFAKSCADYDFDNCDGCPKASRCETCIHLINKDEEHLFGYCDLRRDNFNFEDQCNFYVGD